MTPEQRTDEWNNVNEAINNTKKSRCLIKEVSESMFHLSPKRNLKLDVIDTKKPFNIKSLFPKRSQNLRQNFPPATKPTRPPAGG